MLLAGFVYERGNVTKTNSYLYSGITIVKTGNE